MSGALRWFFLSGAALAIGIAWTFFKDEILQLRQSTPLATGAATVLGGIGVASLIAGAIKESAFITTAISVVTMMAVLRCTFPEVERFLSDNWQLTYLLPYLLGAAASGFAREAFYSKISGTAFFVVACLVLMKPIWALLPAIN